MNAHCCFPSRSHLQPPSYGPVLSPMNKVHGGVNKLPSVNQLVGQPPPHSSAAGPNLGPMGEFPGQQRRPCGPQGPKGGPGWIYRDHKQMMGDLRWLPLPAAPACRRAVAWGRSFQSQGFCAWGWQGGRVKNACLSSLDSHRILKILSFSPPQFPHL